MVLVSPQRNIYLLYLCLPAHQASADFLQTEKQQSISAFLLTFLVLLPTFPKIFCSIVGSTKSSLRYNAPLMLREAPLKLLTKAFGHCL